MSLIYTIDKFGDRILTDHTGDHQIMMEWEKEYMEQCIDVLKPVGDVLEIGFGFGFSADAIMKHDIKSYTIIECSPRVWKKIEFFKKKYALTHPNISITLVKGRWQDVLYTCGTYYAIFFDDYTFEKDRTRYYNFLEQALTSHSHIGTHISSYATAEFTTNCDTVDVENKKFEVDVPPYCKYAKGDKMFLNTLTKTEEYVTTTFAKKAAERPAPRVIDIGYLSDIVPCPSR